MPEPIDDAALTAYALGELHGDARAAVEALLAANESARAEVEAIQGLGTTLRGALATTARLALTDAQRAALEKAATGRPSRAFLGHGRTFWLSSVAAAGLAAVITGAYLTRVGSEALPPAGAPVALEHHTPPVTSAAQPSTFAYYNGYASRSDSAVAADGVTTRFPAEPAPGDVKQREFDLSSGRVGGLVADGPSAPADTESYSHIQDNGFVRVADDPRSTFGVDVDTASYANVRRFLTDGQRPPADAVRIEELVNYFRYDYAGPTDGRPFAVHLDAATCPWAPEHRLVRIALKGREVPAAERPPSNLVFLIDVSGSMDEPSKLPLVKAALRLLLRTLDENDRVAVVVYAGAEGLALPSTRGSDTGAILSAIDALESGGSTHGSAGIRLAYEVAAQNFVRGGINRVILATDGDFNVGVTSEGELVRLIEQKAKTGVFLTALGFGTGNLKDATLEKLADHGNGNYAYVDTLQEARKVLVEESGGTLVTIAKDVKLQVEWNPRHAAAFRLIGYENRVMAHQDFNDDARDSGDIGAGHTVTALYEVIPPGGRLPGAPVDPLKYQRPASPGGDDAGELLTLKLRYKEPDGARSVLLETALPDATQAFAETDDDFRFAASVAAFGMVLRDSPHKGTAAVDRVLEWSRGATGPDADGRRHAFQGLVARARALGVR
jgi:Ca-activated chloride channel family protein